MTLKELSLTTLSGITSFDQIDETKLNPGWYIYLESGGCVIIEKRGDGSIRHALVGNNASIDDDIEHYFRTEHNWF